LFWFSFSLPFAGVNLLLTRTFFSIQRPWIPTALAAGNLAVNALISLALYKPFGIAGLVIGTAVASAGMTAGQAFYLRRELHGRLEGGRTILAVMQMTIAAALLGAVSYGSWWVLDDALGRSIPAQVISVSVAAAAGFVVYAVAVLMLRIPEARRLEQLVSSRLRRRA
jgi:putative peptidoglycan lipid II flippase